MEERDQLFRYLSRYGQLSTREFEVFFQFIHRLQIPRSDYILEAGRVCKHQYFILKGLTRTYHFTADGKERITQFAPENWWITNWESYKREAPSESNIQALEDTVVFQIGKSDLETAFNNVPALERIFRSISENWLIAIQRRSEFYLSLDSKSRYEAFVSNLPGFTQRVPQYMIASYLEISPQHLSVIRAGGAY